ncbi:MAG: hypothetical protein AAFV71_25890 [Cyanobacteria bacterium J06633_8]
MDDTFREMQRFNAELRKFNEQLQSSMRDLQHHHHQVSPIWQDEMYKEYDSQWQEVDDTMKRYLTREGPKYVEFLQKKINDLSRYLYGR